MSSSVRTSYLTPLYILEKFIKSGRERNSEFRQWLWSSNDWRSTELNRMKYSKFLLICVAESAVYFLIGFNQETSHHWLVTILWPPSTSISTIKGKKRNELESFLKKKSSEDKRVKCVNYIGRFSSSSSMWPTFRFKILIVLKKHHSSIFTK